MSNMSLMKNEVLPLILSRIKERKDSLVNMSKFQRTGIEGWLKVEVTTALANTSHSVKQLKNKGPDLLLESGISIELKGATDFNTAGLRAETKKHKTFLLFLQNGSDKKSIERLRSYPDVKVICYETFSDSVNEWIMGLMVPNVDSLIYSKTFE